MEKPAYTRNWTGKVKRNFATFADSLPRPLRILEIGVWEGRTAVWMLENLKPEEYVGIDPWRRSWLDQKKFPDTPEGESKVRAIEALARKNLAPFANATLIKGASQVVLTGASDFTVRYLPKSIGLSYIDGFHNYDAAMADSINVWPLMQSGGVVVWDDTVALSDKRGKRAVNPIQQAADDFLRNKQFTELFRNEQYGVRKA
jgi:predicted O-methyltransferase YrrM